VKTVHISPDDRQRIQKATADAEAKCGAHLAVSIVPTSDRYALYPLVWGALMALVVGGILALAWPHLSLRQGFAIEAALFVVLSLILDWWPLRLRLVPRHIRTHHAHALAQREFAARILSSSQRKGGVLIFLSLGERHAEILADREIHARVGTAAWEAIVADLLASARQNRMADGIVAAIAACAAHL
jgi:putative membrane protein